ncbi:zinc-ribbon domain-containing protein [Lactobacillus amylovorus]|uniref:Lreu_0056 family protein n=1 Tax=Lactobacillus amylovorus TaxID=1604 RepID=UPI00232EEE6F|nr:zinc-ribbon domain-containing protein [Lactobacillus amylovorus]MDB6241981.1 zinc-ribbon domain-containing protein [Lactobacillus amylovorus]
MKKFCPNCGAPLDPNDKFCSHCGYVIDNKQSTNVNEAPTQQITQSGNAQAKSHNKKLFWVVIGAAILLILAIGAGVLFVHHQNEQEIASTVDRMSKRKLAGLTIEYAHLHYKDNSAWNDVYHDAQNGNVTVERYKKYDIDNSTITAKGNNYVYVINKKAIFTTDNDKKNSQSAITLSDGKRQLGVVKATDAYKDVQKHNAVSNLNKINNESMPQLNDRQLAVLVAFNEFGTDDLNGLYKTDDKNFSYGEDYRGFYSFHTGGDGASMIYFKPVGNMVIVKHLDVKHAVDAADAKMMTENVKKSDLINKFYKTDEQKARVNKFAGPDYIRTSDSSDDE